MKHSIRVLLVCVCVFTAGSLLAQQSKVAGGSTGAPGTKDVAPAAEPAAPTASGTSSGQQVAVPRLIKFNGILRDLAGKPLAGPVDVTFSLYTEEAAGSPLWFETQTVSPSADGNYTVLLGAMTPTGVPMELFTTGEAHWLGVQASNLPEQSRVLLVSVPYAMKAGDAETLGGKPASAYLLSSQVDAHAAATSAALSGLITSGATRATTSGDSAVTQAFTQNYIPVFSDNAGTVTNSIMIQSGTKIGINTNAPAFNLDLNGNAFAIGPKAAAPGAGGTMRFRDDTGTQRWLFGIPGSAGSTDFFMYNYSNGHQPIFVQSGAFSNSLYLAGSGNVGVLTNSPSFALDVNSNVIGVGSKTAAPGAGGTLRLRDDTGTVRWALGIPGSAGATNFFLSNLVSGTMPFYVEATAPSNALYLKSTGNVGIGTAAPGQKLSVAGVVESTSGGFKFPDGTTQTTAGGGGGAGVTSFNGRSGVVLPAASDYAFNQISGTVGSTQLSGTYSNALALTNASNSYSGSFTGNGAGLTNLAGANVTGTVPSATSAGTADGLSCAGCVGNSQLGVNYAGSSSQGGAATNALALGGVGPSGYATLGSNAFVGDQMITGGLTVTTNQTISGNLTLAGTVNGWVIIPYTASSCTVFSQPSTCVGGNVLGGYTGLVKSSSVSSRLLVGKNVLAPMSTGGNTITDGVVGGTVSGGGGTVNDYSYSNKVDNNWGTVSGGGSNTAGDGKGPTSNSCCQTVAGGISNTASGSEATVGGGDQNYAEGRADTVAGGYCNDAYGGYSFVGGGYCNFAGGAESTISGGSSNNASAAFSTVAGGGYNNATGTGATVGGGYSNRASGNYSFAAGCNAYADTNGSFVWTSSSTGASQNCVTVKASLTNAAAAGQFIAVAPGGVTFYSSTALNAGASLAAGGGSWSSVSDRNAKRGFELVDGADLLARLDGIPMSTWSYKSQEPSIRHMGPMAQDLYAAFHLGEDDKHITTIDADGVALAGVQALYRLSLKKDEKIREEEKEIRRLAEQNRKLTEEVERLRKQADAVTALEARLARVEAQQKATRDKLARVARPQKKQSGNELARVQF